MIIFAEEKCGNPQKSFVSLRLDKTILLFIEMHFKHPFVDRMNNKCGNIRKDAEIIGKFPHFYRKENVIS